MVKKYGDTSEYLCEELCTFTLSDICGHRNEYRVSKKWVCLTVYNEEIWTPYLKTVHCVGG